MKSIFKLYIFKLVILSVTMIFISFGASAEKLDKDRCSKIYDNVVRGLDFIDNIDLLNKNEREAAEIYRKIIAEWSTIYQAFCKD